MGKVTTSATPEMEASVILLKEEIEKIEMERRTRIGGASGMDLVELPYPSSPGISELVGILQSLPSILQEMSFVRISAFCAVG